MLRIVFCSLLVAALESAAMAGDCCEHCDRCGCQSGCHKVCRVVCETKKVPKITYSCDCEDFCVPGPSDHCVTCDECGHKKHVYTPTCAKVRTRTKLVKHETMEEKCVHKWVVESVCDACASKCSAEEHASLEPRPAPTGEASAAAAEQAGVTAQLRRMVPSILRGN